MRRRLSKQCTAPTTLFSSSMKHEIGKVHAAIKDPSEQPTLDGDMCKISEFLSLDNLFSLLKVLDRMDDAVAVKETIKEIWKANSDEELQRRLYEGISLLLRGDKEKALEIFTQLTTDDPNYGEAWNKKSTCHFMLGDMELSSEAAKRTLEIHPNHFQALSGLGLVQYETKRYKLAAHSFRQSLDLDPWGPMSSKLSACLDLIEALDEEEAGAMEGTAPCET